MVNNAVSINPLTRTFTDALYVDAAANSPAYGYRVEVRDVAGTLLKTLTGSVQSGAISDSWVLTDGNGNVIVSGPVSATFFLDNGGASVASAPAMFRLTKHIAGKAFCIAYSNYRFPRSDLLIGGHVVDTLRAGEGFEPEDYDLLPNGYNDPYSDDPFLWTTNSNSTLTNALADGNCGNLYWMGEANPYAFGSSNERTYLSADNIAQLLGNRGTLGNALLNDHPYRLVIIDGCTSWGIELPKAFGMAVFGEETKPVFNQVGLDPSAYVGWNHPTAQEVLSGRKGSLR